MGLCRFAGLGRVLSRAVDRSRLLAFALVGPVLLSACQDAGYLQKGIGTQLPAADIVQSTSLQDQYFKHLCAQVGYATCDLPTVDRQLWTLVVRQGMNDIDRRCDAYLEWLDNKKRSKGPLIAQSNAVSATAQAIIQIVSPGSAAISIVGIAFGLLNQSIENYQSRLLLEIESSTINSVVLRARLDFRRAIANKSFTNRPDAEYALREYLRRCLPFAIETQINDLSTLGSRGIEITDRNSIFENDLSSHSSLGAEPAQSDTRTNERVVRPKPEFITGAVSADERRLRRTSGIEIQRSLCLPGDGDFGESTRTAIRIYQDVESKSVTGILNQNEINALVPLADCPAGLKNYYEIKQLPSATQVKELATGLKKFYPEVNVDSGIADLRPFLEQFRREKGLDNGPGDFLMGQFTKEMADDLLDRG
jgi:hypothetical protein